MIDISEIEPYLAGLISDVLGAGGVVGGVRIGGGLWVGAVDQAPDVGDLYLEGSIRHSSAVAVRLHLAAAVSIADDTWTAIGWDTADLNDEGMWIVDEAGLITCQVDGFYLIVLNGEFAAANSGNRQFAIRLNGSTILARANIFNPDGAEDTAAGVVVLKALAVGDTIEGLVYQDSGGGLDVGGSVETNMGVVRLA